MATFAIGDLQGCVDDFKALLELVRFDADHDRLWLTGDLVNRGPKSLETLRLVKSLGSAVTTVLGNHDLHLLAAVTPAARNSPSDTLAEVVAAPDKDELLDWLRSRPLAHFDSVDGIEYLMVHAGVLPRWSVLETLRLAQEVELELRSSRWQNVVANIYGNQPDFFDESLKGMARIRAIINVFTRLRFCTADGMLDLKTKEGAGAARPGFMPWFEVPERATAGVTVINGHWSTLGLRVTDNHLSLDSGCVWGGALTAARLEDRHIFSVPCTAHQVPGGTP
jgi:bis(5'-nucleosyl)-tetraphosphatase (symmetrical)